MKTKRFLLFLIFLIAFVGKNTAQEQPWKEIEESILVKKNLSDQENKLLVIRRKAVAGKDDISVARSYYLLLKIADRKTEDSLFLKNAYFIDSLLQDHHSSPLLTSLLYILKAKRIGQFRAQHYSSSGKGLMLLPAGSPDYRQMPRDLLDSLEQNYYDSALSVSKSLKAVEPDLLLWLCSDPLTLLFKPGYPDIIFSENIAALMAHRENYFFSDSSSSWLSQEPDHFFDTSGAAAQQKSMRPVFAIYRSWAMYHFTEKDKFYFIESLARKFFYKKYHTNSQINEPYESYLLSLINSPHPAVKVMGIHQLAFYWKGLGDLYHASGGMYYRPFGDMVNYDTAYRYYYRSAIHLREENNALLDSFGYIKNELDILKDQLLARRLNIQHDDIYLPNQPAPMQLIFKNTTELFVKIVRLQSLRYFDPNYKTDTVALLKTVPLLTAEMKLPVTDDHQEHKAGYQLPALPVGSYAVIFSDTAFETAKKTPSFFIISVSNIAVINQDEKLFALDRTTGQPLSAATVRVRYSEEYKTQKLLSSPKKINGKGWADLKEKYADEVFVVKGRDTLKTEFNKERNGLPDELFENDMEELAGYYEDNMSVAFFTDRAIYRPGQKVYFKGIAFMRDPVTGRRIVLNEENFNRCMKGFGSEELKALYKKIFVNKIPVLVKDGFEETADSVLVSLNEFGSFTGTYQLSKNAPTGRWEFDIDICRKDESNSGYFNVEEYKRPTYEVTIAKPTGFLAFGDSFSVRVNVTSFTGASLTNVRVHYNVTATATVRENGRMSGSLEQEFDVKDSIVYTGTDGKLELQIPASFLRSYQPGKDKDYYVTYSINARAVDATGEIHEDDLTVSLYSYAVDIGNDLKTHYERKEPVQVRFSMKNSYAGIVRKPLNVKLYRIASSPWKKWEALKDYVWADGKWLYQPTLAAPTGTAARELVFEQLVSAADGKLTLPANLLTTGDYELEATCTENEKNIGESITGFSVFDQMAGTFSQAEDEDLHYFPETAAYRGHKLFLDFGTKEKNIYSIYHAKYFVRKGKQTVVKNDYRFIKGEQGISRFSYMVPKDAISDIRLSHLYIVHDELYKWSETITVVEPATVEPEIIIEQYRQRPVPGAKEKFVVTVKTPDPATAAELMSTMYDASLDRITPYDWSVPYDHVSYSVDDHWPGAIHDNSTSGADESIPGSRLQTDNTAPLWWLNPLDYAYGMEADFDDDPGATKLFYSSGGYHGLTGTSGATFNKLFTLNFMNEVQGDFNTALMGSVAGLTIKQEIQENQALESYKIDYVILDGIEYKGDITLLNGLALTDGLALKGAEATALFGSKAAKGVLLLSTRGPVILPNAAPPVTRPRKDFSETAFFMPRIYADKEGYFTLSFTMPESVTEWNWKMMAHTKDGTFVYKDKKIVTQLPMMVQPNMPRFLYQGDRIELQTRITNLDTSMLSGNAVCRIEDAVTGEDLTDRLTKTSTQPFSVAKMSNENAGFSISVPDDILHPLIIRVTAGAGNFSDGEEYTIPVLNRKLLLTSTIPFALTANDSTIKTSPLPATANTYGIGLYIDPKAQAAMIDALPYLAFYPFNCAEQTLNKLLAHTLALHIMQTDSTTATAVRNAAGKIKTMSATSALPGELNEETMPWLQLAHAAELQQAQLLQLFDTLKGKDLQEKYLDELGSLQNKDGGMTWFKGGKSSSFISAYVLNGLGEMKKEKLPFLLTDGSRRTFDQLIPRLVAYCDQQLLNTHSDLLQLADARSTWKDVYPLAPVLAKTIDSFLTMYWGEVSKYILDKQALLIQVSMRYGGAKNKFYALALKQLTSLKQSAIRDEMNGMRWKVMSDKSDLSVTDEECITRLAMAFESAGYPAEVTDILKWLLKARQQHNWSSTKSTAAAVSLLYRQQASITGQEHGLNALAKDSTLSVTDNLLSGKSVDFKLLHEFPATVEVTKKGTGRITGGINYYYFSDTVPAYAENDLARVTKKLYRFNVSGKAWEALSDNSILKIGDKIKTDIRIVAYRQLSYVFIDEKRPAALDVVDAASEYRYGDNISYYASVRDAGHQFFAETVPSGESTISYETTVVKEGSFYYGPVSLQCMYQPQVHLYGQAGKITVEK